MARLACLWLALVGCGRDGRDPGSMAAPWGEPGVALPAIVRWYAPVAAGDFDGDGRLDLVMTGLRGPSALGDRAVYGVGVARGDGLGRFAPPEFAPLPADAYLLPSGLGRSVAADVDGDGHLDLLTV